MLCKHCMFWVYILDVITNETMFYKYLKVFLNTDGAVFQSHLSYEEINQTIKIKVKLNYYFVVNFHVSWFNIAIDPDNLCKHKRWGARSLTPDLINISSPKIMPTTRLCIEVKRENEWKHFTIYCTL